MCNVRQEKPDFYNVHPKYFCVKRIAELFCSLLLFLVLIKIKFSIARKKIRQKSLGSAGKNKVGCVGRKLFLYLTNYLLSAKIDS